MAALKQGTLQLCWDKRQQDLVVDFPRREDGWLLHSFTSGPRPHCNAATMQIEWEPSLIEELERRGYDTTTLLISVRRKPTDTGGNHE